MQQSNKRYMLHPFDLIIHLYIASDMLAVFCLLLALCCSICYGFGNVLSMCCEQYDLHTLQVCFQVKVTLVSFEKIKFANRAHMWPNESKLNP